MPKTVIVAPRSSAQNGCAAACTSRDGGVEAARRVVVRRRDTRDGRFLEIDAARGAAQNQGGERSKKSASHGEGHGFSGSHLGLEAEAPTDEKRAIRRHTGAGLTLGVEHRRAGVREQPRILRREVDAHRLRTDALDEALRNLRADRDVADRRNEPSS